MGNITAKEAKGCVSGAHRETCAVRLYKPWAPGEYMFLEKREGPGGAESLRQATAFGEVLAGLMISGKLAVPRELQISEALRALGGLKVPEKLRVPDVQRGKEFRGRKKF